MQPVLACSWFYTDWLQQLERQQALARKGNERRAGAATGTTAAHGPSPTAAGPQQQDLPSAVESASTAAVTGGGNRHPIQAPDGAPAPAQQPDTAPVPLSQEEAGYEDRQPSFFSLDNPIVATGAMLALLVLASALLRGAGQ